ncbi:glycosyltransferase family 4 protein [Clostridium perfringens]|uniref:glycosyltransferase family 4 protein n=1 Tax=Clostridium perfringens TaxID=1502 RepID=UPI001C887499|nr:glycosyltransferase family 4 protein [Clostridium perfringens]MDM0692002.1 glycosyltransferase family 4 protein [Clostridium perfringens]
MKILYVTALMETINAFLLPHIQMLLDEGNTVECACNINRDINKQLIDSNVKVNNIDFDRNPKKINYKKVIKEIKMLQENNKYDIIHVHTPIAAFLTRFALRKYNCKIIYTAHGFHFYKGASLLNWLIYYPLEKIAARWTDIIITINKEDYINCKKFKLRDKESKVKLIHGVGIDLNKYKSLNKEIKLNKRKELNLSEEDFIIIMIADLNKNKNQIQLIKAIELLNHKYSRIKAILVGNGPIKEYLKDEIQNRNLNENIKLLGFRTDVNELINISDIGVLLSYREGLPRNIMELMANGKRIIATNIRGCRDLVCNDNVGTLVKVGDFEETAEAIERYYLNSKSIEGVDEDCKFNSSEYGISYIESYDIKNVVEELKSIYSYLNSII